jgi:hypothetical protein
MNVTFEVKNTGDERVSDAEISFYFSADKSYTNNDIQMRSVTVSVDPGATKSQTFTLAASDNSGVQPNDYFILMVIDPNEKIADEDPSNNTAATSQAYPFGQTLSDDATLSELSIVPGDISPDFAPDVVDYTATVPYETESITITATASDSNAAIGGAGTHDLVAGENLLEVVVTAENGAEQVYTITANRESDPNQPLEIVDWSVDTSIQNRESGDFWVTVNKSVANVEYAWYLDGSTLPISGITSSTYTYTPTVLEFADAPESHSLRVVVSDGETEVEHVWDPIDVEASWITEEVHYGSNVERIGYHSNINIYNDGIQKWVQIGHQELQNNTRALYSEKRAGALWLDNAEPMDFVLTGYSDGNPATFAFSASAGDNLQTAWNADGNPYLVYYTRVLEIDDYDEKSPIYEDFTHGLMYSTFVGNQWETRAIDLAQYGTFGEYPAAAFDDDGQTLYVLYSCVYSGEEYYAIHLVSIDQDGNHNYLEANRPRDETHGYHHYSYLSMATRTTADILEIHLIYNQYDLAASQQLLCYQRGTSPIVDGVATDWSWTDPKFIDEGNF